VRVLVALLVVLSTTGVDAQMTGSARSDFIESATRSCFKTQRSAGINRLIEDRVLVQYCRCFSTYVADMLNNALVDSIEKGENRMNPAVTQLAEKYCRKNLGNY
jgi:hypothetical protein